MWSSSVSKWNDFRHGGGGWMAHAHALFFRSLFLFLLFSIVCHPYINYIGVANMIKHTRAIDREVEAAATTTTKSHFNTICFVWFFMICFGVQFLLRPIITTRKCVLCNVDFTHSRESAATSRILFLLPPKCKWIWARAWARIRLSESAISSDSLCAVLSCSVYSIWQFFVSRIGFDVCMVNLFVAMNSLRIDQQQQQRVRDKERERLEKKDRDNRKKAHIFWYQQMRHGTMLE